jgi:hypothetical protein
LIREQIVFCQLSQVSVEEDVSAASLMLDATDVRAVQDDPGSRVDKHLRFAGSGLASDHGGRRRLSSPLFYDGSARVLDARFRDAWQGLQCWFFLEETGADVKFCGEE